MSISNFETWFIKKQFSSKMRFKMYRKLIRFLKSGVQLTQALDFMYEHATDGGNKKKAKSPQAIALNEWRLAIRNGKSFSKSIVGWAPDKERIVIEAGEMAGRLDIALENAVFIHQGSAKFVKTIRNGVIYPIMLVAVAIIFLYVFGTQVIPAFDAIVPKERWTGIGAQMAFISDFVQDGLLQTLAVIMGLVALFFITLPRWKGKIRSVFDQYPPWSLYRITMGSGFLISISSMHKSGIPLSQSLIILMRDANPWYTEKLQTTLRYVRSGQNFGQALHRTGFNFPDKEIVMDLKSYAELQGFDEVLGEMGRSWMEESLERIVIQTQIMKTAALLFMAGTFGYLILGVFALQDQIQSAIQMGG